MHGKHFLVHSDEQIISRPSIFSVSVLVTDLCSSFLDHFQLTFVDLDAPEETIKEPQENPSCQPEQKR